MTSSNSELPRRIGEFALIAKYFAPLSAAAPGAFGLKDDVATLALPADEELVATVDAIVESVHFLRADPPDLVARKALRVNLSDLAAKGARAYGYLLSLSLAPWVDENWIARFASGLAADQAAFGVALLGGDTTATPGALTISITALGSLAKGKCIRRAGARPGDLVFVTGSIGDAGGGLALLKGAPHVLSASDRDSLLDRYRLPQPRLRFGRSLPGLASASLDVSDGLLADLGHIAEVSEVRIVIEAERVPLSKAIIALWGETPEAIVRAASAGDDYEIAFTAPPGARTALAAAARSAGIALSEIGRVEEGLGVALLSHGIPVAVESAGYTHF